VRQVVETGRPLVGGLGTGSVSQTHVVPVLVPVERQGRVIAVLGYLVPPASLSSLLSDQALTSGRYAEIVDGNGVIVARSSDADHAVGSHASDWFLQDAAGKADGLLEGESVTTRKPIVLAFRRLSNASGWILVVGEPRAVSAAEMRRPILAFGIGGGTVLLLALSCAAWVARRLLRDVETLERQAEALVAEAGGGQGAASRRAPLDHGAAAVSEFAGLGKAMLRASRALRDREDRQTLLVREVDHRAKNALAVVQAMVCLTPAENPKTFQKAIQGRVEALARTHTTLAKRGWGATDLRALLAAELAPHRDAASLIGPTIDIAAKAAQPIAMVAHELATNAAKHGGLSVAGGTVTVVWWTRGDALCLRWTEAGGPAVSGPPDRRGFGLRMIVANIGGQLGGTASMVWEPSFSCEVCLPSNRVLDSQALSSVHSL
jgi:two-component sensor histidine kinase